MVVTDPIADFLIRIKNGSLARKDAIEVRWSTIKQKMAEILVEEGYLKGFKVKKDKFQVLVLDLLYKDKRPVLTGVKRLSKPGVRIYTKAKKMPSIKKAGGLTLVSTPQGLMTSQQARKKNLGGEVIGQVW
ncbi:30S ribosomal protein S8 [Candidatus Shapirobacteria bacterium]|nr:30S ribosomal protein S8 [Candidatus Shapirobacteria bacterium]